eukprot:Gb_18499 [translate_table: standard]
MTFPLKLVLGIVGNATSLGLYLSPLPTFWKIFKLKSTQEFSGLPYVCTLFNCGLWLLYGTPYVKPNSTLILTINGVGFLLELFYLTIFLTYASRKKKLITMHLTLAMSLAFATVVVVTLVAVHTYTVRQLVAGTLCVILSIAMYASPLSIMGLVIRTKSVDSMPFLLSFFNLMNALVWCAYSVATRDIYIAIPNGIGSLSGTVQLILYYLYRNSKPANKIELPETKPTDSFTVSIQKVQEDAAVPTKVSSPRSKIYLQLCSNGVMRMEDVIRILGAFPLLEGLENLYISHGSPTQIFLIGNPYGIPILTII